jgi:hypothetical protein
MLDVDFGDNERKLLPDELFVGQRVFKDSIKWWQVRINDGHGLDGSIWTNAGIGLDRIYVTKAHYARVPNDILIHELVHVWQATNLGFTGWGYKLNSFAHQAYHTALGHGRNAAYNYNRARLGKDGFEDFSSEEQAQLVEDWFQRGEQRTDPAFPYIHHCIRECDYIGKFLGHIAPPPV